MFQELQIINIGVLEIYKYVFKTDFHKLFDALDDTQTKALKLDFYTSVSAVYSSKIEGENIELDSFLKHKAELASFQPDYTRKIDDLYDAYLFANNNSLNHQNVLKCHEIVTRHILEKSKQGRIRTGLMYVLTDEGTIEYVAAAPQVLKSELAKFFVDIDLLLRTDLPISEVFYFASMLHLVFVKIHPFEDGNGRMARLLEKWFIAEKLGAKAWLIRSEKYYYDHHSDYYKNIRRLGFEYGDLNYENSEAFLQMLPQSLMKENS